jgi:AbrB family looped-hinge helix DNA binding protein
MPYMTVDQKGRATLPEEVRTELGIVAGDVLMLERTERGSYELRVGAIVPKEDLWFLHPEVQARVKEGEEDVRAGRSKTIAPSDDLRSALAAETGKKSRR